jgi:hypothetical protein
MDTLRYIELSVGGRPVTLLDLNDGVKLIIERDTFKVTPGVKEPVFSVAHRRYGGSRQVAETTENGSISWKTLVVGKSEDECFVLIEALLARMEANPLGSLIEWKPDATALSSLYEVRGTATWTPEYKEEPFIGVYGLLFSVSIPVAPLALGLPLDILDGFTVDTRGDYTYDSGVSSNEAVEGGVLKAVANVTVEQRAIHTARGYSYGDNQQTSKGIPGATITGWKNGVILKRAAATTAIEVYVDDEGVNSRLRIDKLVAGVRTNLAAANLVARVANGVAHWVRGRIEGNVIVAEYFTAAPTPMGAPTLTNTYTLKAGAEIEAFGATIKGAPGRVWTPQTVGAAIDEYSVEPYTYRSASLPGQIVLSGAIPGDAPAKADITLTTAYAPLGGLPIWALLGWSKRPGSGLAAAPFGIMEAETASNLSGWASEANVGARGELMLLDKAALFTDVYTASWAVDPSLMVADEFTGEVAIEVWARVMLAPTIITPSLTLSTHPEDGLTYGTPRYTEEWGSVGKLLVTPTEAAGRFRMTRLGTLQMLVDPLRPRKWLVWLDGKVGAGSSGEWGTDYLILVPAAQRACSPSGKANDASYPTFIPSFNETSKTVRSDLSALISVPPKYGHPDHGLGGQLIELPPGETELVAKLSDLVPDDPTSNGLSEHLSRSVTVHVAVTPRWYLARSGS